MNGIKILKQNRKYLLEMVSDLDEKALMTVLKGFKTNILWNLGHLVVTQQLLIYLSSKTQMLIPRSMRKDFQISTSPEQWSSIPDLEEVKSYLLELPEKLEQDYERSVFKDYREFKSMTGVQLCSIEEAIDFNNFHEGYHTGIIHVIKNNLDKHEQEIIH